MTVDPRHPTTVLGAVALAVVVRVLALPAPVRPAVLGAFLLVVPGAALVGSARSWSGPAWWTAVLSASLGVATLVSTALLYAGAWTPDRVLGVLAVGSALGCGLHLARERRGAS